jgi:3-hydroxyisobutyrate dehydrogenase
VSRRPGCASRFDDVWRSILHLGAVGAGQTAKLINNLAFTAQLAFSLEVFSFVAELGVDRESMAKVLESGSGGSRAASIVSDSSFDLKGLGQVAGPLLQKDVALITDVAERSNVDLPACVFGLAQSSLAALNPPETTKT